MKEDVIIDRSSPSLHFFSGLGAFIIYFCVLVLLLGGFHFFKEKLKHGDTSANSEIILQDLNPLQIENSVELADVIDNTSKAEDISEENIDTKKINVEKIEYNQSIEEKKDSAISTKKIAQNPIKEDSIKQEERLKATQVRESRLQKPATQTPIKQTPPDQKYDIQKSIEQKPDVKESKNNLSDAKQTLDDIFANVSSQTMRDKKLQEELAKKEELMQRKKEREEAKKRQMDKMAQNAKVIEQNTKTLQQSAKNLHENVRQAFASKAQLEKPKFQGNTQDRAKYDEWYGKIEQILMSEWRKSPKFLESSARAKVRISIDSNGRLKFLFITKESPYNEYNKSVIDFLKHMEKKPFPIPPMDIDSSSDPIEMNLELENVLQHQ